MPFSFRHSVAFAVVALSPVLASSQSVFSDAFDGSDLARSGSRPRFWTVVQPDNNRDSRARKADGRVQLRAANRAYTYVALVSPVETGFGFFAKPVTITLDEVALKADGIPENDARFKLSVVASSERAERANAAISVRVRPGLLLLGYRFEGYNTDASPENLSGQSPNAVLAAPLTGVPSKLVLTLGPSSTPGHVRFEVRAEGDGVTLNRTGSFPLTLDQWGKADSAALAIDVRRDHPSEGEGTAAELSIGQLTVTR